MFGYRARIGFLVPPGAPTVEPEMYRHAPEGVSVHFTRMVAGGTPGSHQGQDERNLSQIAHLEQNVELIAMVKPDVIVMAHTASSYTLGRQGEAELIARMQHKTGKPFITAFGSVMAALSHLGVSRVALCTPYSAESTAKGRAYLEAHGFEVVSVANLEGISNIYDQTAEGAYRLARSVDVPAAQAVFLSGVGMPTLSVLQALESDLGKPVISSAAAMLWNALRTAGVREGVPGCGQLLR
jgi:maleate isomerase